jgi:hypothetical protein
MDIPEWRAIDEFSMYEIDACGRVRSWRRKSASGKWYGYPANIGRKSAPTIMTPYYDKRGYARYSFRDDAGKMHSKTAHRLVALAFLPNPHNFRDVAHDDGDPRNNHVSNLRWCTHRDNQMDMRRHGTMQDGERCVTCKITEQQALEIRERCKKRGDGIKLAKEFGLSKAQISRIKNNVRWAYLNK